MLSAICLRQYLDYMTDGGQVPVRGGGADTVVLEAFNIVMLYMPLLVIVSCLLFLTNSVVGKAKAAIRVCRRPEMDMVMNEGNRNQLALI